jgi:hypothetical protein
MSTNPLRSSSFATYAPLRVARGKQRHWLASGWLMLMMAGYLLSMLYMVGMLFSGAGLLWSLLSVACCAAGAGCVHALWQWKKWGFLGLAGVAMTHATINLLAGAGFMAYISGVIGMGVLYAVLQVGKPGKPSAWSQLA